MSKRPPTVPPGDDMGKVHYCPNYSHQRHWILFPMLSASTLLCTSRVTEKRKSNSMCIMFWVQIPSTQLPCKALLSPLTQELKLKEVE